MTTQRRYVWGSVSLSPYLAPDPICSSVVRQICDRRHLIKVGTVTRGYLWALSVSIRDSLVK